MRPEACGNFLEIMIFGPLAQNNIAGRQDAQVADPVFGEFEPAYCCRAFVNLRDPLPIC